MSRDREPDARRPRLGQTGHGDRAGLAVVLHRVGQEVQQHLLQALAIGHHVHVGGRPRRRQLHAAGGGLGPHQLERGADDLGDAHRLERHRQPARLDPRDVEHLVDQRQQVAAGPEDVLDALALVGVAAAHLEDLAEAEDGVQGRAQLVAHPRQELALGAVGGLGARPRRAGARPPRWPAPALAPTRRA